MEHIGTRTLESERLILRRFTMDDAQDMYKNWASDPEVTKYLMWPAHESVDVTKQILTGWANQYDKADYYHWAITIKENDGAPIGSIGAVSQDDRTKMVHIGYCLGRKWWNRGLMSEALGLLVSYFFNEVKVNRIESRFDPNNPNSGKVMTRCGLTYEGTKRQADWNNQGICDAALYAILAEDYYKEQ